MEGYKYIVENKNITTKKETKRNGADGTVLEMHNITSTNHNRLLLQALTGLINLVNK